ncbi:MAG: hypothetical protein RL577_11, partial [Bacteroidota bacterium]
SAQPLGSIGGCLSPDRRDEKGQKNRVFLDVQTGLDIPFEWKKSELIDSSDLLEIGRFRFRQSGFDWVQAQLKKWAENVDLKTLVIDEIGPLELRLNSGMEPGLSQFVAAMKQSSQSGRKVLFVVRDYLLEDFIRRFDLENSTVNQGPWFSETSEIEGLLLMGGQSSRMGSDKALLDYHGMPQYRYALNQLQRALGSNSSCWVSASESQEFSLHAHETKVSDSEVFAGNGPISGVLSVHLEAPNKSLLVMGVDYPYLQEYALNRLVSAYRVSGRSVCFAPANADSKLPVRNQLEPLVALYAPSDLQSLLLYFKRGGRSLRTFLIESQALVLPYDEKMGLTSVDHPQQKPS